MSQKLFINFFVYNSMKKFNCNCGETLVENFYKTNKSKCKKCLITYQKKHIKENPNIINQRYLAAKHRSIRKGLEFSIDESYIHDLLKEQNNRCKYSGILLDTTTIGDDTKNKTIMNYNTLSIDRLDSTEGYIEGNIVLVTSIVNTMKNNLTEEEFLSLIETIYLKNLKT